MPRYVFECQCKHTKEKTLSFLEFDALSNSPLHCFACACEFDEKDDFVHDGLIEMTVVPQVVNFVLRY